MKTVIVSVQRQQAPAASYSCCIGYRQTRPRGRVEDACYKKVIQYYDIVGGRGQTLLGLAAGRVFPSPGLGQGVGTRERYQAIKGEYSLRMELPDKSNRWELWIKRSMMASARVESPITSGHCFWGAQLATRVELSP